MTLTLAVDTTGDTGSIALADEDGVREEVVLSAPRGFSHVLFGEIEGLLERQGVTLAEVGLFAGASGPGSFTGVRVGLAAIKGLAESLGKRAAGVSNLRALAEFGAGPMRATIIDAHRGEVFAALFGEESMAESVLELGRFRELLGARKADWISQDAALLEGAPEGCARVLAPAGMAGMVARIALRDLHAGAVCDPAAMEANYVRRSDAEILWKEDL